jgi:DNA-binding winged helix-turn-helix (wHTH) protein
VSTIRFDHFTLDREQKTVTGPDGPVNLRPQTFAVLCHLVEQAPSVVSRDDLLDAVWGHQATSVSSVAQTIKELRQALGDSSADPRLIATRRRLGYQFIGNIHDDQQPAQPESAFSAPGPATTNQPVIGLPWPVLVVMFLALIAVTLWWSGNQSTPLLPSERLPTLAVAQMVNASDDPELNWLGPALETYLGHALVELGGFRVLAVDRLSMDDESQLTDVDFLIEGRYLTAGVDGSRLLASLRRPGSSEIVTSLESGFSGWDVASLSIHMATSIRDRLGFTAPPDADSNAIRARLPRLASSQRSYFTALDAIGKRQPDAALAAIAAAREHEPDNPRLDHLQALALKGRGDWQAARRASERALAATTLWPRRDRLELEATAAMLDFDFERAADSLQALSQFYPEPESNRRLIEALIQSGRLRAAGEGLDSMQLKHPRDPRLALLKADLAQADRDHQRQLEAADKAIDLAISENQPELLPASLLARAGALIELGQLDQARDSLNELLTLAEPVTDADRSHGASWAGPNPVSTRRSGTRTCDRPTGTSLVCIDSAPIRPGRNSHGHRLHS